MKKNFFVLAAVVFSIRLSAQDELTISDTAKGLDEVIVSANKYPNKTSLTGKVVTIISQEQIQKSGGKDLSQLLAEQAGVYINGANSNPGKDKNIYLRGGSISHTLITIDGIPVSDPSGIGGNFDLRNLSLSNIERIEILKGSQSTLYGSDAINGVVNIITRKNVKKPFGANALVSYGNNETFRGHAGINGKKGITDYNASFAYHGTKGINETENKNNIPVTDKDSYKQTGFQFDIGIHPSENFSIKPFFRYGKLSGDIDQGAFTDELDYTYTQKSWQAGLKNEFIIGKSKINLLYNYNNIYRLYIDDSVKSRNGYDTYSKGEYSGGEHLIDAYVHTPLHKLLKLTAGGDFRFTDINYNYLSLPAWGPPTAIDTTLSQQGFYTALNLKTPGGPNIEAGGRINFHSAYKNHFVFNINPSYLLNNKVKVFANLSSGYKTPTLYQLFSEYGNASLKPEKALTAEAGVQYFSPDKKFNTRITGFKRSVKDVFTFYYDAATWTSMYINRDKQEDYGFEWEGSYKAGKTTVRASYSFTDGNITTKTSAGKDTAYFNLMRRPKSSFNINIGNQFTKSLFLSTSLTAVGKREDAYFDSNTFATVPVTLKSYALLDVYTEYTFSKYRIKLFAELRNITNTKYTEIAGFNTLRFNSYGGIRFTL